MAQLELYCFGSPRIRRDGNEERIGRRKVVALLAYLAVTGKNQSRESLTSLLFPDAEPHRARNDFRQVLSHAKGFVGEGVIFANRETVGISENSLWVDVCVFRRLVSSANRERESEGEREDLEQAARLYQGDFLSGFYLKGSLAFDDWQRSEQDRLSLEYVDVLTVLATAMGKHGLYDKALEYAQRLVKHDPLSEDSHCLLVDLYHRSGNRRAALKQYEQCRSTLKAELGIVPSESMEALRRRITASDNASPSSTNSLPRQLTTFVGRERELVELDDLLSGSPFITIAGAAGCGKTRLAIEIARKTILRTDIPVWFVDLTQVSEGHHIVAAVASAIGIQEQSYVLLDDQIVESLRVRKAIIILDNCEHIIEDCADLVSLLLDQCRGIKIIATSREPLRATGEAVWVVRPLSFPGDVRERSNEDKDLLEFEAVRLFADRARASAPHAKIGNDNVQVVADICRCLEGIPLAIELAASRLQSMTLNQLHRGIRDSVLGATGSNRSDVSRHQTLRSAIDWSYALLSGKERALFRRISVFRGGWTLDAAAEVGSCQNGCSVNIKRDEVFALMTQLVEKSLVILDERRGKARYRFLEMVRQFAGTKLAESDEESSARKAHTSWYMAFADRAEPELYGHNQMLWFDGVETELENLRAIMNRAAGHREYEVCLHVAGSLWWFWYVQHHYVEAKSLLETVLSATKDIKSIDRVKCLVSYGFVLYIFQDFERLRAYSQEALDLAEQLGDKTWIGWSLLIKGVGLFKAEPAESQLSCYRQSRAIFGEIGDTWGTVNSLRLLADRIPLSREGIERRRELFSEALRLCKTVGDRANLAWLYYGLSSVPMSQNCYHEAGKLLQKSLSFANQVKNRLGIMQNYETLGVMCGEMGNFRESISHLLRAMMLYLDQGRLISVVHCTERLAISFIGMKNHRMAARLMGAAKEIHKKLPKGFEISVIDDFDDYLSAARKGLGETTYNELFSEGTLMTIPEIKEMAELTLEG